MKKVNLKFIILWASLICSINCLPANVSFKFSGLGNGDKAVVTIGSSAYLESIDIFENGTFEFNDVPVGRHYLKVDASGYNLPDAQIVDVNSDGSVNPVASINIVITKMNEDPTVWTHTWEQDGSISGYTTTAHVNQRPEVEFLGKKIIPADVPSMQLLLDNYKILLSDEEETWTHEYAYRLLETLKTLPVAYNKIAKFVLTSSRLTDDIEVTNLADAKEVRISKDAFFYANPFLVSLDGVRGRFFSKRLHHAMTKFVTDFGKDTTAVNQILFERFGCSVSIPDYEILTGENPGNFQDFYPSELVAIINMFEELPDGFHKTPHLNYLVRRQDGHVNPKYPGAAAISWCVDNGYIEFINAPHLGNSAFGGNNEQFDTQRLILHEKTHFLWAFNFSDEIKNKWIEIGGWYLDPNVESGWVTSKDTEFVTAYAHAHNPDEDMAESVAYYLKDPEKLLSRAPEKYEFIRDAIMHGTRYITSIPDYLTFEVLNLYPDYDFPGKIKKVDISVTGAPDEDKELIFDIYLNHIDGYQDGASSAFTRIMSPKFIDDEGNENGTYIDLWFGQVDGNEWHLRGTANISKYSKAGFWVPGDITISDVVGNERYEGRNDCVSNIYINNPLEDLIVPKYEKGSLSYSLHDIDFMGHHEQLLSVKINAYDNIGIKDIYGGLYTGVDSNHMPGWSTVVDKDNQTIEIQYRIKDFFHCGNYHIAHISITDLGGVSKDIRFDEDPGHEPVQHIYINTPNPDYDNAEVDLNRIYVHAEPTNPDAPNGETLVDIVYYVRDNLSGVAYSGVTLRDPQGVDHFYWAATGDTDDAGYFLGDPYAWKKYETKIVLPVGSAPGIWGVSQMNLRDNALNDFTYNFVESLIFEPDDNESDYVLFAEMKEDELLTFGIDGLSMNNYGFTYRIINEETGQEISGKHIFSDTRGDDSRHATVNVSGLDDGSLLLIVTAINEEESPISVKSAKINKKSNSSVKTIKSNNQNLSVIIRDRKIIFNGNNEFDDTIKVFTIKGLLYSQGSKVDIENITFEPGIYLIIIGENVAKIVIYS